MDQHQQKLSSSNVPEPREVKEEFSGPADYGLDYGYGAGINILGPNSLGVLGIPTFSDGPMVLNENTALSIPAFWSGVRFLSETLSQLPVDVYQQQKDGTKRHDREHPLDWLLNDEINDLSTPVVIKEVLYQHAIVWGNGYLWIERDGNGKVSGLFTLLPDRIIPFRMDDASGRTRQWYALGLNGVANPIPIAASDILHIPGLGYDGMRGYPIVEIMRTNLQLAMSAERFGEKFFSNGGHLGGTIETEGKLTAEQIDTMRAQIHSGHTGVANAHKFMVLQGGAKAKTLALPPDSAQYLETRKFSVTDIARILRVPPHALYDLDRATWNNIEQMGIDLVKYSLSTWLVKTEQEVNRKLFTPAEWRGGYYVKLNVDALQRGDHVQQIDSTSKRLACGLTNIDDERALYDLPPVAYGDKHFVPTNWMTIDKASQALPQPQKKDAGQPEELNSTQEPTGTAETPQDGSNARQKASRPDLQPYGALISDAGSRVGTKTAKATANARQRFASGDGWTPWCNSFAEEQARYASEAVTPLVTTLNAVAGAQIVPEGTAAKVGSRYAASLRLYFARLARSEEGAEAPDLAEIITKTINEGADNE